jgi:hypothetical protein
VPCLPSFKQASQNGAIVSLADAIEHMHLELVRAALHSQACPRPQIREQIVSKLSRIDSHKHGRSVSLIGFRPVQRDSPRE